METNKEKLAALKQFLRENNVEFAEKFYSKSFDVTMDLGIKSCMIAVFLSDGDNVRETELCHKKMVNGKAPFQAVYRPFFIRTSESKDFVLEKMQNCIVDRMLMMQERWQKKQQKQSKQKQQKSV